MLRKISVAIFLVVFLGNTSQLLASETYDDCILKNMKGVQDRLAAVSIQEACERKTTPKKCRRYLDYAENGTMTLQELKTPRSVLLSKCLQECKKASLWNRTVGECSK